MALAAGHLLFLASYQFASGFWPFTTFLLGCYSLPFLLLTQLRLPPGPLLKRAVVIAVVAGVIGVNVFIPTRRFLPGYRSTPLESLVYLALPIAECLPIGLVLALL